MKHLTKKKLSDFAHRWWFGLLLAALLVLFEVSIDAMLVSATPAGSRWLGATIFNTGDVPVYLNYLAQAKNSFLLHNLFNNLPQIPQFDTFWSLGGLLVRMGLTPLWAHEILRWLCTAILAFAVYATARAVTRTERQARIASLLMVSGLSTGWLYDVWMGLTNHWTHQSLATADFASEFAIAPVLLGGAHMILSIALQLLAIRWSWFVIRDSRKKFLLPACLSILALTSFHPYFIPLLGLISLMALWSNLKTENRKKSLLSFLAINAMMLPAAIYYFWLTLNDPNFRIHHFQANYLPLDPWYFWVIMLLPFLPAAYWMMRNQIAQEYHWPEKPTWIMAWIISAALCILLPFPWMRKYTQALLPALVILTLPFWLMLADKLWSKRLIWPLKACSLVLVAIPFIHLLQTQVFMVTDPYWSKDFYRPNALFQAWDFLRQTSPPQSLIITTDLWSNHWTPTYSLRYVWIGHKHETPDFADRIAPYLAWTRTTDVDPFRKYLATIPVTHLIATNADDTKRLSNLIDPQTWSLDFLQDGVAVWRKK